MWKEGRGAHGERWGRGFGRGGGACTEEAIASGTHIQIWTYQCYLVKCHCKANCKWPSKSAEHRCTTQAACRLSVDHRLMVQLTAGWASPNTHAFVLQAYDDTISCIPYSGRQQLNKVWYTASDVTEAIISAAGRGNPQNQSRPSTFCITEGCNNGKELHQAHQAAAACPSPLVRAYTQV